MDLLCFVHEIQACTLIDIWIHSLEFFALVGYCFIMAQIKHSNSKPSKSMLPLDILKITHRASN